MDIPVDLLSLWQPQFEQLHAPLERCGPVLACELANDRCSCHAWVLPLSPGYAVIDHDVVPTRDLDFYEAPRTPYACLCTCSVASVRIMPDCGIDHRPMRPMANGGASDDVYSFTYTHANEARAVLRRGQRYRSRSICMTPAFFKDLGERYPEEGFDLMESFNDAWALEADVAIRMALRRLGTRDMRAPGAHLFAEGTIHALIAQLAEARMAHKNAILGAGSYDSTLLSRELKACIERALDAHHAPSLDELAGQLYVSRSKLCAVFKRESGESLGTYIQRRRMERAKELLADGRAPAQAGLAVGYSSPSSFSQAFKKWAGCTPGSFRKSIR